MTTIRESTPEDIAWYAIPTQDAARRLSVVPAGGFEDYEAPRRLPEHGPNELPAEPPPSRWAVARGPLLNPMNIMLLIVGAASIAIGQAPTALVVLALVTFNIVMGTSQEMKARASVEALARLQVPRARVRRSGEVAEVDSTTLVPGDIALIEAGEAVPAAGRVGSPPP